MPVRYTLQGIHFEWDARKASSNRCKHRVDFEVACQVFFDPFLKIASAGEQSGERREAIVGFTMKWQLLFVVFVEREEVFRLISARRATRLERTLYEDS